MLVVDISLVDARTTTLLYAYEQLVVFGVGIMSTKATVVKASTIRPEIRRDYPLNLSILISGGKETNEDSLSNGE